MAHSNKNYLELPKSYFFVEIAQKVAEHKKLRPNQEIIRLSIGDVTLPLVPAVAQALREAVEEMTKKETFQGYGPEQGQSFLIETILHNDYVSRGIPIEADEIFVSDGSKCDVANFQELFDTCDRVAVVDPAYPVYIDSNAMSGRLGRFVNNKWENLIYLPCAIENNFIPELPKQKPDLIYLCYPNNPTGTTLSKKELEKWVAYAHEVNAVILFDAAYEAFITDPTIPHSIFEIDGAREVAVEFRSFSKTAGFTGLRCAYTVAPKDLKVKTPTGTTQSLNAMWRRRQTTKYNGCSYLVQKGAAAAYSPEGKRQIKTNVQYYMNNAKTIKDSLEKMGVFTVGGVNAPYVWLKTPDNINSWEFFDLLLNKTGVVGTPGVGFGPCGEGYFRLTGFGSYEDTCLAVERIQKNF